jgi:hypothetical protein
MTDTSKDMTNKPERVSGKEPKVEQVIGKLAEKKPQIVSEMTSVMGMVGNFNPLLNKLTAEHISQALDFTKTHDENQFSLLKQRQDQEHEDRKATRIFLFLIFLVGFVCYLFRNQPHVLLPLITGISGLAAGFWGGYGVGKTQKEE